MILFLIFIFMIIFFYNSKESFSQIDNDENYYNYCFRNYTIRNCVPDERCLNFGFKNICS